jgi:hypothetical protein
MIRLCKANIRRLIKNRLFIFGSIVIFFIALWYVRYGGSFILTTDSADQRAMMINALIPGFITLFYGLFTAPELSEGVIRNKLSVGYRQSSVYLSYAVTSVASVCVLTLVWLAASILGGVKITSGFLLFIIVSLFSSVNYAGLIHLFCMRIRKSILAIALSILTLQTLASVLLFINAFYSAYEDMTFKFILNMLPLGQWLTYTPLSTEGAGMSPVVMTVISLISTTVYVLIGSIGINRREIK